MTLFLGNCTRQSGDDAHKVLSLDIIGILVLAVFTWYFLTFPMTFWVQLCRFEQLYQLPGGTQKSHVISRGTTDGVGLEGWGLAVFVAWYHPQGRGSGRRGFTSPHHFHLSEAAGLWL